MRAFVPSMCWTPPTLSFSTFFESILVAQSRAIICWLAGGPIKGSETSEGRKLVVIGQSWHS